MELTNKELKAVDALKDGADIITSSNHTGAYISGHSGKDFKIGNKVFMALTEKKIIIQSLEFPFDYKFNKTLIN